jgi:DAACS family dicarboxylate/amino acid:cation (Na+ or H+) symporter
MKKREELPDPPPRRFPFYVRILLAMATGALLGFLAGPRAAPLGEAGRVVITLIKALAAPLLFFAILDAFLRTAIHGRAAARMVAISLTNAVIALGIGLALSNVLRPGEASTALRQAAASGAPAKAPEALDFGKVVSGLVPSSLLEPFVENTILTIVVIAVLLGAALRRVKAEQIARGETGYRPVEEAVAALLRAFEQMLAWVIAIVPLAVLGVVAQTVGQHGFAPFAGLGPYVGVALLGLAIQVFVVYQSWLLLVARLPLGEFWRGARDAVVYALGASSSLATLPVTLKCLDRMKVSPASARLAACVGTNLNNDGILLYEAMAVLFVAQVHGITLSIGQQAAAALVCLVAGIGIAGVPEAGLISLSLVLATVGLPLEILPLLLTVDWLLSRARAMTNVTSDMVVAVLLDSFAKRGRAAAPAGAAEAAGSG